MPTLQCARGEPRPHRLATSCVTITSTFRQRRRPRKTTHRGAGRKTPKADRSFPALSVRARTSRLSRVLAIASRGGRMIREGLQQRIELPLGLGARHVAAASISKRLGVIAIAVSEEGIVRVFCDGRIVATVEDFR